MFIIASCLIFVAVVRIIPNIASLCRRRKQRVWSVHCITDNCISSYCLMLTLHNIICRLVRLGGLMMWVLVLNFVMSVSLGKGGQGKASTG